MKRPSLFWPWNRREAEPPQVRRRVLQLTELEERVLYSAAPASGIDVLPAPDADAGHAHHVTEAHPFGIDPQLFPLVVADLSQPAPETMPALELHHLAHDGDAAPSSLIEPATIVATGHVKHELVFVDADIEHHTQVLEALRELHDPMRELEIIVLSPDRDGVEQISAAMATHHDLSAVHIFSHGIDGAVQLGATRLSIENLAAYSGQIAQWHNALAAGADLLIDGGNLAASDSGQSLIDGLHVLTGADIAVSTDATGSASLDSAALGGNWNLAAASGPIETAPLLTVPIHVRHELVFVDTQVANYQPLVDDLLSHLDASRQIELVYLDPTRDGVQQISDVLSQHHDLDAVHLVSHGEDGALKLGGTWLTSDLLRADAAQIAGWGSALTTDGDLLVYGCELAAHAEGQKIVDLLATLTGADVAASTNNTGSTLLGGDWNLEYRHGSVESSLAFSADLQQNWFGLMAVTVDAISTGSTTGTSVTISHTTTSASNREMVVGVSIRETGTTAVSSMTYNGVSLTFKGSVLSAGAKVEIWSLVAPSSGTNNLVVNLNNAGGGTNVGVMTFTGVDQTTPLGAFGSASGDATSGSATVSSATGDLVIGAVAVKDINQDLIPGGSQTERWDLFTGTEANGGGSTAAGAASVNMSWTWTAGTNWAIGGVSVHQSTNTAPVITSNGAGASASVNTAENLTAVTTVTATDVDLPAQTLTYSISGGADAAKFAINSSSGVLTFVAAPNYEAPTDSGTDNVYDVTVQVSDGTLTDTQAIAVTVTPVNDNTPVITSNGAGATAAINVAENATAVTTVTATDADLPAQTLTYTISGGADAAKFAINSSSGALTFLAAPNYEVPTDSGTDNVYDVTVQVSDDTLTDTQAIAVTITPLNDNTPTITSNGAGATAAVNVAENSTAVTTVTATDSDLPGQTLTYTISGGVDAAKFAIDANTGELTFVAAPDYEVPLDADSDNVYDLIVQASDGTLIDEQTIAVTVTPTNDNTPIITSNGGGGATATVSLTENNSAVTTVIATDADLPTQSLTYSISGGADAARFAINATTGTLSFNTAPNYEAPTDADSNNVYLVTVTVDDGFGGTDTQTLSVTITDVNEFSVSTPIDTDNTLDAVNENAANGTVVGVTAFASDADGTTNGITYSFDDNAGGLFAIDGSSGELTVSGLLDYEAAISHDVTVRATSADGSSTARAFTIVITDVNETSIGAISDTNAANNEVAENSTVGTTIGVTAFASDPDGTATVSYSLDDDASGLFAINSTTGAVTVAGALNAETALLHNITIRATSTDSSFTTRTFAIAILDLNEFDITVLSDTNPAVNAVDENAANGTVVGITAFAIDDDATTNSIIYSLTDDAGGRFAIDGTTGVVTVANGSLLDREAAASHSITVQAQSDDGSTSTRSFAITLNPINEAPVITAPLAVSVNESDAYVFSTGVGDSLVVSDVDAATLDVTITVSTGGFTLKQTTGLTFVSGDGLFDSMMRFTGNIADINAALDDAQYQHGLTHGVTETLSMLVSDLGQSGIGGILTASSVTTITIVNPTAVVGDGFLQGNYLEIGMGQDGALGSDGAAPVGFNSVGGLLGAEVDNERDGWATFDGDFVTPGSPVETWGVHVGGTTYSNSNIGTPQVSGGLVNFQSLPTGQSVEWLGNQSGLAIQQIYTVGSNNLYMDVEVRLTNLSGTDLTDIYYYRNVDPDNNVDQGSADGFTTTNTIVSQGNVAGISLVSATQADGSYLGLMGFGENSRVTYGGFNNLNPLDIYNGTGGLNQSGSNRSDAAVSLAFHYDTIAVGETTSLRMRYYFGATDAALPVVDLDADNSHGTTGGNYSAAFTENGGPIAIVDADATVLNPSGSTLDSMSVTLTNLLDGNAESLLADTSGTSITASYDSGTGMLTLSGTDSTDHYRTVLQTLTYNNTSESPTETARLITVTAMSGANVSEVVTATVSVTAINDVPVITSDGGGPTALFTQAENIAAVTTVASTDLDGGRATYSLSGPDANDFTINATTGELRFTAAPNFEISNDADADNVYDVTVTASDGVGGFDSQDIRIRLTDINEFDVTPINDTDATINAVAENAPVGTPVGLTAFASDADATTNGISYTLDNNANGQFAIDATTGVVTVAGAIDYEAAPTRTIIVRATSQDLSTTTQTFVIAVQNLNDNVPLAGNDNFTVGEDGSLTVPIAGVLFNDSDADLNLIVAVLDAGPSHGALALNADGSFAYTPDANYFGADCFTYRAVDLGGALSNVATVTITVSEINDTPVTSDLSLTTNEDTLISGNVLSAVIDPDNIDGLIGNEDTLTVVLNAGPSHGSLTLNADGSFVYTPDANYFGADSFVYYVVDSDGAISNVATVTIAVSEINDTPVANDFSVTTNEETLVSGNVLSSVSDPDNTDGLSGNDDTLTAVLDAGPSHGVLSLNANGSFAYTPDANYFGADSFIYHAVDSRGAIGNVATVTISVHETNVAPVAHDDNVATDQNTPLTISVPGVLGNDTDADGDVLHAVLVSGPTHGTLTLARDGHFVYSPDAVFSGTDSFSYQASDDRRTSNTVVVTITVRALGTGVTPTDHPPPPPPVTPPGENPHPVVPPVICPPPNVPANPVVGTEPELSRIPVLPPAPTLAMVETPLIVAELSQMRSASAWLQLGRSDQDLFTVTDEETSASDVDVLLTLPPAITFQVDWQWNNQPDETQNKDQSPLSLENMAAGATVSVVSAFSVGYALWTLRGGYLLTSFLAALPAWQMMDPLPVLQSFATAKNADEEEDEDLDRHGRREGRSLSALVQHRSRKVATASDPENPQPIPHHDGPGRMMTGGQLTHAHD